MTNNPFLKIVLKYLGIVLGVLSLLYLVFKLNSYHQQNIGIIFLDTFRQGSAIYLYTAFFLFTVNYGIEAYKWKLLLLPLQPVSWLYALKAVLAGISVSIFTPNRSGEVVGKLYFMDINEKMKAALLNFSGSMAQMICTCILGLWGTVYYLQNHTFKDINIPTLPVITGIAVICTIIAFLIYFNQQKFFNAIRHKQWARSLKIDFTDKQQFSTLLQAKILVLSFIRYIVFSTQLVLLLRFGGVETLVTDLYVLSAIFFLVMWFMPSFAVAELGIRGSVALFIFQQNIPDISGILLAVILLWVINVALPALIGSIFLFGVSLKAKN